MADVTTRKVVMSNQFRDETSGNHVVFEAVDYVPVGDVDRYVADARTRWQNVTVSDPVTGAAVTVNTGLASGGVTTTLGKGN